MKKDDLSVKSSSKEKLSSEFRDEILAVGDSSQSFAPRVRIGDLYTKRASSGRLERTYIFDR